MRKKEALRDGPFLHGRWNAFEASSQVTGSLPDSPVMMSRRSLNLKRKPTGRNERRGTSIVVNESSNKAIAQNTQEEGDRMFPSPYKRYVTEVTESQIGLEGFADFMGRPSFPQRRESYRKKAPDTVKSCLHHLKKNSREGG